VKILEFERSLADLSDPMLLGVVSQFGRNSSEYEAAGGVRKSEQVRRRFTNCMSCALPKRDRGAISSRFQSTICW